MLIYADNIFVNTFGCKIKQVSNSFIKCYITQFIKNQIVECSEIEICLGEVSARLFCISEKACITKIGLRNELYG